MLCRPLNLLDADMTVPTYHDKITMVRDGMEVLQWKHVEAAIDRDRQQDLRILNFIVKDQWHGITTFDYDYLDQLAVRIVLENQE